MPSLVGRSPAVFRQMPRPGGVIWGNRVDGPRPVKPYAGDELVYVGSEGWFIYAVDLSSGRRAGSSRANRQCDLEARPSSHVSVKIMVITDGTDCIFTAPMCQIWLCQSGSKNESCSYFRAQRAWRLCLCGLNDETSLRYLMSEKDEFSEVNNAVFSDSFLNRLWTEEAVLFWNK